MAFARRNSRFSCSKRFTRSARILRTRRTACSFCSTVYRRVVGLSNEPMTQSSFPRDGVSADPRALQSVLATAASPKDIEVFRSWDKVNVNGGAIGPRTLIGATGAMLNGTLLDELERRDLTTGLVTMCTGGGMATATIIERV